MWKSRALILTLPRCANLRNFFCFVLIFHRYFRMLGRQFCLFTFFVMRQMWTWKVLKSWMSSSFNCFDRNSIHPTDRKSFSFWYWISIVLHEILSSTRFLWQQQTLSIFINRVNKLAYLQIGNKMSIFDLLPILWGKRKSIHKVWPRCCTCVTFFGRSIYE